MFAYSWPGNVRELQNVMERAVLLCKGAVIEEGAMPSAQPAPKIVAAATAAAASGGPVAENAESWSVAQSNSADLTLDQLTRSIINKMPDPRAGGPRLDVFAELERAIITAALERTKGNKQAAANLLGLYRPRLYSMLRKHNLHSTIRETERGSVPPDPGSISSDPAANGAGQ